MIDVEAEARAIHKGKHDAWDAAVHKLCQAWDSGDQAAIEAWQKVFGRYRAIANRSRKDDGFYNLHIFMDAGEYAGGLDPRPEPPMTDEERAALAADLAEAEAEYEAERTAGLHDHPSTGDPNFDDDIPF